MKQLTQYRKNGHDFQLVRREAGIAIFHGKRIGGNSETWEVIHIQSHNGREIGGSYCPPAEFPPSNEQWGAKGWTLTSLDDAEARMDSELVKLNQPNQ